MTTETAEQQSEQVTSWDEVPLLRVRDLNAYYDESHVLHGLDFDVHKGEVVTLLGRNGAGKSTTLKCLMGLNDQRTGSILFRDRELINAQPYHIAHLGMGYCPEERGIYASLTAEENLMLPPKVMGGGMSVEEIYEYFPNLWERRKSQGTKLSGGEQQMLAIARILRSGAQTLLLDEPTEGLAPVIVRQIGDLLTQLKGKDYTILLVEQNFRFAQTVADRHYVVEDGRIATMIHNAELDQHIDTLREYLAV